jgi:hypothetical protein
MERGENAPSPHQRINLARIVIIPPDISTSRHPLTQPLVMSYVVSVDGSTPAWIWKSSSKSMPCFTFQRPDGVTLEEAEALKDRADICCGGTLKIVELD